MARPLSSVERRELISSKDLVGKIVQENINRERVVQLFAGFTETP
jgi:hypothetical protein